MMTIENICNSTYRPLDLEGDKILFTVIIYVTVDNLHYYNNTNIQNQGIYGKNVTLQGDMLLPRC